MIRPAPFPVPRPRPRPRPFASASPSPFPFPFPRPLAVAPALTVALALALGPTLALAPGCDPATHGELGQARLRFDGGLYGCLNGCDADEAIAAAATVDAVLTNAADLPSCTGAGSDDAVLEWTGDCDSRLRGLARAPGRAALLLTRDLDLSLLDRFWFDVAAPARVWLGDEPIPGAGAIGGAAEPFLVMAGGTARLLARPYDAAGRRLVGVGALEFSAEGDLPAAVTLVSASAYLAAGAPAGSVQDFVEVLAGAAAADGFLAARALVAPGGGGANPAEARVAASVVDVFDVADVALDAEPRRPHVGEPWLVEATARDAAGVRIRSPQCDWSWEPATAATPAGATARDAILLVPARSGVDLYVGCVVGDAAAQLVARVRD